MPELNKRYYISSDPESRGFPEQVPAPSRPSASPGIVPTQRVRESEPRPIRIYLQDGRNDNRFADAEMDWFLSNVRLTDALESRGYDVAYSWGVHTDTSLASGTMYPEMMRWLWRDHAVSTDPHDVLERNRPPGPSSGDRRMTLNITRGMHAN